MKSKVVSVVIDIDDHYGNVNERSFVKVYRTGPSIHDFEVERYPLTEKNYWRAVGMQLRLAGFEKKETA